MSQSSMCMNENTANSQLLDTAGIVVLELPSSYSTATDKEEKENEKWN